MNYKYNPKIDIKFLTHISNEYDNFSSELHIKNVYRGKVVAKTFSDKIFERNALAFSFIKNIQNLSLSDIEYIVSLFDKTFVLNEGETKKFINLILSKKSDYSIEVMVDLFLKSLELFQSSDKQMDLSILFCNFSRINNGVYPIIFFNSYKFYIRQAIKNGSLTKEYLIDLFDKLELKTNRYNNPHEFISLEDIIKSLLNIRSSLENRFDIETLSIYGSYSRNEATEYSDLDLLISISFNIEQYNKKVLIDFLKENLHLPVDILIKEEINVKKRVMPDMFDDLIEVF